MNDKQICYKNISLFIVYGLLKLEFLTCPLGLWAVYILYRNKTWVSPEASREILWRPQRAKRRRNRALCPPQKSADLPRRGTCWPLLWTSILLLTTQGILYLRVKVVNGMLPKEKGCIAGTSKKRRQLQCRDWERQLLQVHWYT